MSLKNGTSQVGSKVWVWWVGSIQDPLYAWLHPRAAHTRAKRAFMASQYLIIGWEVRVSRMGPLRSGPRGRTDGVGEYKTPGMRDSIRAQSALFYRVFVRLHMNECEWVPHLSKGTSGLKQKCTQTPTSFLGTVFQALSHCMIHFVLRVSSKNLVMEVSDWLLKNFSQ